MQKDSSLWGVLIGRFQPFHDGHAYLVRQVLDDVDELVMVVGSAGGPRTIKNPWTLEERQDMIRAGLAPELAERVRIVGVPDVFYDEQRWLDHVTQAVEGVLSDGDRVRLYGHTKDASSYYLKLFPNWEYREEPNYRNLSATPMREAILASTPERVGALIDLLPDVEMPAGVRQWLKSFCATSDYMSLLHEAKAIQSYKDSWAQSPYTPIFVTVDALITRGEEVLLIRRGQYPGKGLLALPGGFLDPEERIDTAARRELREETGLALAPDTKPSTIFIADHPDRSDRGRFITHVYHYELDASAPRPVVRGGDDAASAHWYPLAGLPAHELFEDHRQILEHVLGVSRLNG